MIINSIHLKSKNICINLSVLLYFILFSTVNQIKSGFLFLMFYISLGLCALFGFLLNKAWFRNLFVLIILICTGLLNHYMIGNFTLKDCVYLIFYFFSCFAISSKYISERTLLFSFLFIAAIIIMRYLTVGLYGQLFTNASNNFVSVYLMYPLVCYYSVVARNKSDIKLYPVLLAWILTLLARGRGGILTVTFFFLGVYLIRYRSLVYQKKILIKLILIIIVSILMFNLSSIIKVVSSSVVMEQFNERGGLKSSRTRFWSEYFTKAFLNFKNFILGADVSHLIIGRIFGGNPHNSFIEMHITNGIIGFSLIFCFLIRSLIISAYNRNYLFLFCLVFSILRGLTDHVLWNAYGTPILFFLMFYNSYAENTQSDNEKNLLDKFV